MSTLVFISFGKENNVYLFPYLCYYFLKDCIHDCPSNALIMPPFAQEVDPHLYLLMVLISCSFKPPCSPCGSFAWTQREECRKKPVVSLSNNNKPNSLLPYFCQLQPLFSVGFVLQCRKEITPLQMRFSSAALPLLQCSMHPPLAFIL